MHFNRELMHDRVARVAAATPEATALDAGSRRLTFRELDRKATRLSSRLRSSGVGVGSRVALLLNRSPELAVAALAVLRAGAAYVPLDPGAPAARLRGMAADAAVAGWLTSGVLAARVPGGVTPIALVDQLMSGIDRETAGSEQGAAQVGPNHPAYVIFTSGSTGRPKGVEVRHGALANLVDWHLKAHRVTPTDRATLVANPAFDASVWELWPYLAAGAAVHVPGESDLGSVEALVNWLVRCGITISFLPTPLAELALLADWPAETRLRTLLTGGDRLRRRPPSRLPFELINNYGPTECTVVATAGRVEPAGSGAAGPPSVGRPLPGIRAYVLDRAGASVRGDAAGELHLGGPQVAVGYVGHPELTAERFVPDPFSGTAGARMYRTGDLVRWTPLSELEFIGRVDQQVKIRGHRIEPGEIESRLAEHPGVLQAAVTAREDLPGERRLVAYLVCAGSPPALAELRQFLRQRLPESMLPSLFVVLERLPLTANGKLDRAALPAPEAGRLEGGQSYRAPETATERALAEIWGELLGRPSVGLDDDFFELGGHSLLATQVVSRVRDRLARELPLRSIFESPSIAALARTLDAGAPAAERDATDSILRAARPGPLSFAQERLWFLHELFPNSAEYNVPVVLRLRGQLDARSLERALATLTERHEILRSRVATAEGRPALVIDPAASVSLPVHDLTLAAGEPGEEAVERVLGAATGTPFDLAGGPPMRAALVRLGGDQHLLALTFHHMVFDGWSVGVFLRELELCYRAHAAGTTPALPALPIQYGDFAAWQRNPARRQGLAEQVAFWRDRLRGVPPLQLPADGPRPEVRPGPGRGVPFALPQQVAQGLFRLSQERGTTPFATLLAAFQVLLSRHTGQRDLAVAVPVAGRTRSETEGLVGFFVNTLVLRADLSGNPRFADVLDLARDSLLEGLTHQEAPFDRVVEELHPDRDLRRNPLAQALFGARDSLPSFDASGLAVERYEWGQGSAGFDLAVEVEVSPAGVQGRIDFPAGLFEEETIRRLADHYQALVAGIVADPGARLEELPLATAGALRRVLADGAGLQTAVPARLLHELVTQRAASWPSATALEWEGGRLSYAQLDTWAAEIRASLRAAGAGPGAVVAVLLPRGPELVAAILGVLQAGAAYLPLEPSQPRDRLELMLADAAAGFALTDQRLSSRLDGLPVHVLRIDRPATEAALPANPPAAGSPEQLAYVIFTSGSTGRPKPVAVPHRALVNHALAMLEVLEIQPSDRVLQFASAGFDVFAEEVFPTLLAGARLVFPAASASPVQSVAEFDRTLQAGAITLVNLPASFWAQWTKDVLATHRRPPAGLRLIVIGSEQADGRLLERWRRHSGVPVANVYGVSEATISTTAHMPAGAAPSGRVPIGRPIANTEAYVLDGGMRPLPSGVIGELFLGGLGLAQGYFDRPDLTAERFLPNPYGPPGSRLYRTGDLARWLPSSSLDVVGRVDQQVKIRGHRIEPGEIESRLAEHPGVLQAAVTAREDLPGERRLVAYLVCAGSPPALAELRQFLRQRLPESMLPSLFVVLERLPLTANGKLDRAALPAPEAGRLEGGQSYRAPETATERALAEIWGELLGRPSVGLDDDFFELGGHSLLATQVVSRVRDRLARELPLRSIFESPSIAALAKALEVSAPAAAQSPAPALRPAARAAYRIAAGQLDSPIGSHKSGGAAHVE